MNQVAEKSLPQVAPPKEDKAFYLHKEFEDFLHEVRRAAHFQGVSSKHIDRIEKVLRKEFGKEPA